MLERSELSRILERVGKPQPASFFESQHLDFKEPRRSIKETLGMLADAAVCFANADGGTIVLGVNDKATTRAQALIGADPAYSLDVVRLGIFERTSPHLTTFAYELDQEDVRILVVEIPPGVLLHANSAGTATRRVGKTCQPFTPDQQREVMMARGHFDWSAESTGISTRDLSSAEVDRARTLLAEHRNNDLARLQRKPLLDALNLIAPDGTASNAAVLLFGSTELIQQVVPAYGLSYQYRPTSGTEAVSRFRDVRPLIAAIEATLFAVARRVEVRPLNLAGGIQVELADYPMDAVREIVVNAFIHRSYDSPGTVDLEHTSERFIVTSPGRLVSGVTPSNILTHPATPRHRLLADVVARLRLAERTGQGIDRAYREMLRAGKEPPTFEEVGMTTRVVLGGGIGNDAFVRFVADLPKGLSRDVEILLGISHLRAHTSVDAKRLAGVIQRSVTEAQDVLDRLAADDIGIIEPTRGTAAKHFPTYRFRSEPLAALARAVTYRRRTIDQTDEKVIEHVREYGFITNRTLQRMLDINVYTARNALTDLQARGIVNKIGQARGGPGVKYDRGAKFPR